jgi:hypothetical protein
MLKEIRSNISIQVCDNGYVLEYSGTTVDGNYKCFRVVCEDLDRLVKILESLTDLPLEHY